MEMTWVPVLASVNFRSDFGTPFPSTTLTMPIHIIARAMFDGITTIPYGLTIAKVVTGFAVLYLLKWYFNGAVNGSERNMHSKVVMVTVSLLSYRL